MTSPVHPAVWDPHVLMRECEVLHKRVRGPGGQKRNKTESAVEIRHTPTGLVGAASERREQVQNHRVALFRLRVNLALEWRCPADPAQPPSALWQSRVTEPRRPPLPANQPLGNLGKPFPAATGRIAVNPEHHDFPALLAEALDVIETCGYDLSEAAKWLGVSPSQLGKFLALEPRAMQRVNQQRLLRGFKAWR